MRVFSFLCSDVVGRRQERSMVLFLGYLKNILTIFTTAGLRLP